MNKILIAALLFACCFGNISAQESGKSKSSTKNYEKAGDKRNDVELWNCSNINTPRNDFAPAFYQYGIVFASSEKNGQIDAKTDERFFQLYYAETDRNHIPMSPRLYSLEANTPYHEGGSSYDKKWNTMYYSSNNQKRGFTVADKSGNINMKIYEAHRGDRDWEKVTALPFNSDNYTCFHPTLSADGRALYFASNMPGGQGDYDLYYVEKKGDSWGKPVNLGPKINTPGKEAFPFIHESGFLFFASNGHANSLGGFDLYKIDLNKTAATPTNMGEPFNSTADDLGLILNSDAEIGYFSSNRDGGFGKDDIYLFKSQKRLTTETFSLNGLITVKDQTTGERIEGAAIRVFEKKDGGFLVGDQYYDVKIGSGNDGGGLSVETVRKAAEQLGKPDRYTTSNGDAQYELKNDNEYLIIATKDGYQSQEITYNTFNKAPGLAFIDMTLNKVEKPKFKAVIISEKTNTGIPNANIKIVNPVTQKTEVYTTNANGEFDFVPTPNTTYNVTIEKQGYKTVNTTIAVGADINKALEAKYSLVPVEPEVITKPLVTGSVIVLEKIYYDFDKAIIRQGAAQELDALAQLMNQYKTMKIELVSHTDSRGKTEYNQKLSDQRAISAKNYLVAKGVAADRIVARGAGESQVRNRCADGVNCSESEHQYNRRTEVKVTSINEPTVQVQYGDKGPEVINGKN